MPQPSNKLLVGGGRDGLVIETTRLTIYPPTSEDLAAWQALSADPKAMKYLGGVHTAAVAWTHLSTAAGSWALQGFGPFSVVEKSSGRWIGRFGPWKPPSWAYGELTGALSRESQWHGIATEGVKKVRDWVFENLDWDEVMGFIHKENVSALRIARLLNMKEVERDLIPDRLNQRQYRAFRQSRCDWEQDSRSAPP